jgi:hypothetical protein
MSSIPTRFSDSHSDTASEATKTDRHAVVAPLEPGPSDCHWDLSVAAVVRRSVKRAALVTVGLALAWTAAATAAPPRGGVFEPGRSLGGLRLGSTPAQVRAAWGTAYGHCRDCRTPTWYFNYARFSPEGAGVEFRRGRVDAIFTLWSPAGWRTTGGLRIGDEEARVTAIYAALNRAECGSYRVLLLPRGRVVSAFYIVNGRVWGFGLLKAPSRPCR